VFPKTWPADREQRARIIGEWLQTEARFQFLAQLTHARKRSPAPTTARTAMVVENRGAGDLSRDF
jgi:hypothetical protein